VVSRTLIFRDFTYRNPQGKKKGEELADAVVLFDDVALLVQVKAQHGTHEAQAWATDGFGRPTCRWCVCRGAGLLASLFGSRTTDAASTFISDPRTVGPTIKSGGITPPNTVRIRIFTDVWIRKGSVWFCAASQSTLIQK
jgi:hypothetical protein